jgi:glycosyltransferase involved in cell wall biosynthesis
MTTGRLASIIIDNYNYARFLGEAIESALAQRYPYTEVIVVDDGSTDESREVIARYGGRVIPVLKENGGQASAFNAGFRASSGDVILFLDADDVLLRTALEKAMPLFEDPDVVKVHWPLWLVDVEGRNSGQMCPGPNLPDGDFRESVFRLGPTSQLSAPGCGNAWVRYLLERLFPIPEHVYRNGCDTFLFEAAPFFGMLRAISEPQTLYRQHGNNDHVVGGPETKIQRELEFYEHYAPLLSRYCRSIGIEADMHAWKHNSWWHRQDQALRDIVAVVEPGRALILADGGTWELGAIAGRRRIPFLEKDGEYGGAPRDDETAIHELARLRATGAGYMVLGWPAFWWLEQYPAFNEYLRERFPCLLENERVLIFDLQTGE